MPDVSVVLASHNEGDALRSTVDSLVEKLAGDAEVIVVDDRSTDGSAAFLADGYRDVRLVTPPARSGAAGARNFGADHARGELLVFSDAHVEVEAGWLEALRDALAAPRVGAVSPAIETIGDRTRTGYGHTWTGDDLTWRWLPRAANTPYPVPFIPAGFVALTRETFDRCGGFDGGLAIWGSVGDELSMRLWLLGADCLVAPAVKVAHLFRKRHPYDISWEVVLHNQLRLAAVHFSAARLRRLCAHLAARRSFQPAFERLLAGDAAARRRRYRQLRVRDDDWFFSRFGIDALSASDGRAALPAVCKEGLRLVTAGEPDEDLQAVG